MNVSLTTYARLLKQHDWTYQYSDDMRMYKRGQNERRELTRILQQSDDHRALFELAVKQHDWVYQCGGRCER